MFASFDLLYAFAHRYLCSAWRSSKSSPCRAPLCASDDTTTTRAGALARSRSSSRSVSRKWPRWLTPKVVSKPSSVSVRRRWINPALFTRTSSWSNRPRKSAANDRMDRKLARSSGITSTDELPLRSAISWRAARPRSSLRAVMTTCAPADATPTAASLPIPVFPPVITTRFPFMVLIPGHAIRASTIRGGGGRRINVGSSTRPLGGGEPTDCGKERRHGGRIPPDRGPRRRRRSPYRCADRHGRSRRLHVVSALRVVDDLRLAARRRERRPLPGASVPRVRGGEADVPTGHECAHHPHARS